MPIIEEKRLVCVDPRTNHNKIWIGELHDDGTVITKWGRVGKNMQSKTFPGAGESFLNKKMREKEKKGYNEIDSVTSVKKEGSSQVVNRDLKQIAVEQIEYNDSSVADLIEFLVDQNKHQIAQMSGGQMSVDTSGLITTATGDVVSLSAISKARTLLSTLGTYVKQSKFDDDDFMDSLGEYLMLIPQEVGHARGWHRDFFSGSDSVQKQSVFLDSLEGSIKLAEDMAGGDDKKKDSKKAPSVFQTALNLISTKREINKIQKLFDQTAQRKHACYGFRVKRVFGVEIADMSKAFASHGAKMDNVWDLWHGTATGNVLSILRGGYYVPPSNAAHVTGRMFGNGVYFSDQSTKSLNYAYGYWSGGRSSNKCYMFMNKVAMGNFEVPRGPLSRYPAKGYDSYYAQANKSGVMNHEMIVPKTSQCNITHLVEFEK